MKIKEVVNVINNSSDNIVVAKVMDNDVIVKRSGSDIPFLRVPINAIAWCFVYEDWNYLYDIKATDLARVMDVVQRLIDTPIKERFPEKKYRLRWIDYKHDIGDSFDSPETYLGRASDDCGGTYWTTYSIDGAETFTESELEQLKKDNLRLAPAIDAMKEEVKDDERESDQPSSCF